MSRWSARFLQGLALLALGAALGGLWNFSREGTLWSHAKVASGTYADVIMAMKDGIVVDARTSVGIQDALGANALHPGEPNAAHWREWSVPNVGQQVVVLQADSDQRRASDLARILAVRWNCLVLICKVVGEEDT